MTPAGPPTGGYMQPAPMYPLLQQLGGGGLLPASLMGGGGGYLPPGY
jgi:hypothetical protein